MGSVVMLGVVLRGACRGRERQREAEREGMCFQLRVDQTLVGVDIRIGCALALW